MGFYGDINMTAMPTNVGTTWVIKTKYGEGIGFTIVHDGYSAKTKEKYPNWIPCAIYPHEKGIMKGALMLQKGTKIIIRKAYPHNWDDKEIHPRTKKPIVNTTWVVRDLVVLEKGKKLTSTPEGQMVEEYSTQTPIVEKEKVTNTDMQAFIAAAVAAEMAKLHTAVKDGNDLVDPQTGEILSNEETGL